MLSINKITKSFLQRGKVLDELSLEVGEGDSISVSGPSGSGKTTLLNIIGLLDRPDSGEVIFKGVSILGLDHEESALYRNRNIGFMFQDHLLLPYLTLRENIQLPLMAAGIGEQQYRERVDEALRMMETIGISSIADKYPFQVSGGEAQRATLIRALVNKPSVLLADEPTGSLDRKNAGTLGDLLIRMNSEFGITLILATHSRELADKMKIQYFLSEGKLIKGRLN